MVIAERHVKNMSGGLVGQIIVRVLAGLVSAATAFTMNVVAPQKSSSIEHVLSLIHI